jgi:outer membrane protein OmpA-like peptidoglycan-associated protein
VTSGVGLHSAGLAALSAVGVAALVGSAFVLNAVSSHRDEPRRQPPTLIVADQVTAEEGFDPKPPAGLVERAVALASDGRGRLVLLRGGGTGAVQAGEDVALRQEREHGQAETDPTAIRDGVTRTLDDAFTAAAKVHAPGPGRDLLSLLGAVSGRLTGGSAELWLRTFGMPTVDPANTRVLMSADPVQAVAAIAGSIPRLAHVTVHLILLPPAGDQPPLNELTNSWRHAFLTALLTTAGATLRDVEEVRRPLPAAPGAPLAPPVSSLPNPTQRPARPPTPHVPFVNPLDTATTFRPDSAALASGEAAVLAQLEPVITGWKAGRYGRVEVVGRTARFGPRDTAVHLSQQRAALIAALLQQQGVPVAKSTGLGFDQPLPPSPTDPANRVVTVTAYPKERTR